ncbi:hypothetical protein PG989_013791 [Apiospora arundinis]
MRYFDAVIFAISYLVLCATCSQVEQEYPYRHCPRNGVANFEISDWNSGSSNGTNYVSFNLSTDFNDFTALCYAENDKEPYYDWTVCHTSVPDHSSNASFSMTRVFGSDVYLSISHQTACNRSDGDIYDEIAPAFIQGQGNVTDAETATGGRTARIPVTTVQLPLNRPDPKCLDASRQGPEWRLSGLSYSATPWIPPPNPVSGGGGVIAGTFGSFSFGFLNKALGYYVDCAAMWFSPSLIPENDTIIDPNMSFTCPFTVRDPDNIYPNTTFRFDKAARQVTIEQDWRCEDVPGVNIQFSGKATAVIEPECILSPVSWDCGAKTFVVRPRLG